jgi:hypothetical protein
MRDTPAHEGDPCKITLAMAQQLVLSFQAGNLPLIGPWSLRKTAEEAVSP